MHVATARLLASTAAIAALATGCASTAPDGDKKAEEVYTAPETALGSNLPRRGERRNGEVKEVKGDALETLKGSITPGPLKGSGS
jgi:hypothetical protein